MRNLSSSIIIVGKICSGKSSLAKTLSIQLNIPIASFGAYLFNYANENNLKADRESLQDLGNALINDNYSIFLNNVINFSSTNSDKFIFEGVRHKIIFNEIIKNCTEYSSIFLNTNINLRLKRFLEREKPIDENLSEDDFYKRDSHHVESEIEEIKDQCKFVISDASDFSTLIPKLLNKTI